MPVARAGAVLAPVGGAFSPQPKGEVAKPGKRAATVEEGEWMAAAVEHGCIACWLDGRGFNPACIHHILRGGVRMGHLWTIPLCPGHHQDGTGAPGLIARHPWKTRFEERYGTELFLLVLVYDRISATRRASGLAPLLRAAPR